MIEEQQPAEPDEDLAPDADDDGDGMPLELAWSTRATSCPMRSTAPPRSRISRRSRTR
jgi:hypothetical protein